jgi:outer membrane protein, multidrug efflux system
VGRAAPDLDPDHFVAQLPLSDAVLMKRREHDRGSTRARTQRFLFPAGGLAIAIVLNGCALVRPPTQPETLANALPEGTAVPGRWASRANRQPVTNNWVKSFHDPGLDRVVDQAVANNLDLRQAAARVQVAQQIVQVVRSSLLPKVGIDTGHSTTYVSGESNRTDSQQQLGLFSWEIDLWGKLRSRTAAAKASSQAAGLDYAYARQSLAATTAKLWYLAIEAQQLRALAERDVSIYTELLRLVNARQVAGRVSDFDVVQAQASVAEARSASLEAQNAYTEAIRGLEQLIGRYPAADLRISSNYPRMPGTVRAGLPSTLLERRPDVAAAEQKVLAAFREVKAARLALLPSFNLNMTGGRLSDNLLSILKLNPWLVYGVIDMTVPIYSGGELIAKVRIATAKQQEAVASYGSTVLTAFREVENGLTSDTILAQRVALQAAAVNDRGEAVRIGNLKFNAGSIDLLSLLQLQSYQNASEAALIKLQDTRIANRINLYLALGGGFDNAPAASDQP